MYFRYLMKAKKVIFSLLFGVHMVQGQSQPADFRITRQQYIERYKDLAIKEMLRTGIPASITMAQAILESGDGNSPLARYGNNHFGIKCHADWTGEVMHIDDDEKGECFRKYKNPYQSFVDHSEFLRSRPRYAFLFEYPVTDYKSWAVGLKKAGYATNPQYDELLIKIIESNKLYELDTYAKMPPRVRKRGDISMEIEISEAQIKVSDNGIKYILGVKGYTPQKVAKMMNMAPWQIIKYNDINKNHQFSDNEVIYLQPKRSKNKKVDEHVVKTGETMWSISQQYGIKLKKLYRLNNMLPGTDVKVGQVLRLH